MSKKISEDFNTSQVPVTATASKVVSAGARDSVTLYNSGSTQAFAGKAGVTAATGFPIPAGAALVMENTQDIYAITASGSTTLAILVEA